MLELLGRFTLADDILGYLVFHTGSKVFQCLTTNETKKLVKMFGCEKVSLSDVILKLPTDMPILNLEQIPKNAIKSDKFLRNTCKHAVKKAV